MRHHLLALLGLACISACHPRTAASGDASHAQSAVPVAPARPALLTRIAFGSCAEQDKPMPILEAVVREKPDLFVFLGDNIYGDTDDMAVLRKGYAELGRKPEFQHLRAATFINATWDDHDYGTNDIGRHYARKAESKEIFLDFWQEPANSERRKHPGIYHSEYYGEGAQRVQVILLDNRTFRDDLLSNNDKRRWKNDYRPNENPDSTFLGAAQWAWLERELRQPAAFRIVATSNQFCHEYNGFESWTNVPREQQRMLDLIQSTRAEGLVFTSGDVHWGELSMRRTEGLYPLYDMTSSGITETWPKIEANKYRVGNPQPANNYGLFTIDWKADPELKMELKTVDGKSTVTQVVKLSELGFR